MKTSTTTAKAAGPTVRRVREQQAGRRAELVEAFLQLRPVLKRHFAVQLEHELRDELHNVTVHQLEALGCLRHNSHTMSELAKDLGVGESAATALTDRLVRQGLVERGSDPKDRRIVRLELSRSGRRLVERLHESTGRKSAAMLEVLSDEQLEHLVDILATLSSSLPGCPGACAGGNFSSSKTTTTDGSPE